MKTGKTTRTLTVISAVLALCLLGGCSAKDEMAMDPMHKEMMGDETMHQTKPMKPMTGQMDDMKSDQKGQEMQKPAM